jgi:hypothetical protein
LIRDGAHSARPSPLDLNELTGLLIGPDHIRPYTRLCARYFVSRGCAGAVAELTCCAARTEDDCLLPVLLIHCEISAPVRRLFVRRTFALRANEDHGAHLQAVRLDAPDGAYGLVLAKQMLLMR